MQPIFSRLHPGIHAGRLACAVVISILMAACGGGGGGGSASSSSSAANQPSSASTSTAEQPSTSSSDNSAAAPAETSADNSSDSNLPDPTLQDIGAAPAEIGSGTLLISEISPNYYVNDVAWLEIYNPGDRAVNLSWYALRSSYVDASNYTMSLSPMTFALPAVAVPAKGHVIVAGRVYDNLKNNAQIVYVNNGSVTPFWNTNGSLELVAGDRTIDFVRLGTSTATPLSAAEWGGANVTSLPSGANEYGRAIVRLAAGGMADTNSARDWSLVNFATPAGMNDIAPGVLDSDRDGVPDSAKVRGGTYAGLDLYAMGARPGQRDLFIEIDYMKSGDPGITPRQEALQKLLEAFREKNIAAHIDTGKLHGAAFDPAQFNLGGGNGVIYASCIQMAAASEDTTPGCTSFYDIKSKNFDVRRKFLFHYAVFANSMNPGGSSGSSGMAEMYGNDLIVSLGGYGLNTVPGPGVNLLINLQASTLMHELGHNLGLRHGGNDDLNYKPNHYSVMNYMYQFSGLTDTPSSVHAAERYYLANNLRGKTYCNLTENSPCGASFRIGYSNGSSIDLDENALSESANIGRGSDPGAYADWNHDGAFTESVVARNITPQIGTEMTVLRDFDEWSNLTFAFSRHFSGATTGASFARRTIQPRANPMNQNPRNKLEELPLPSSLQSDIQKAVRDRLGAMVQ